MSTISTMSNLVWLDGSLFRAAIPSYQFFFINDTRLNTITEYFYRRVLALSLSITPPRPGCSGVHVRAVLKDITSSLYKIEPEDEEENS